MASAIIMTAVSAVRKGSSITLLLSSWHKPLVAHSIEVILLFASSLNKMLIVVGCQYSVVPEPLCEYSLSLIYIGITS